MRSSWSASVSRTTSLTRSVRLYFRGERSGDTVDLEPCRLDVEQLDVGRVGDVALDPVEDLPQVTVALGDDRDRDRRALPRVLVIDLGHRDLHAVAQAVDDRAQHRALRLQRAALRHEELEADGCGVHTTIVALRTSDFLLFVRLDHVARLQVLEVGEPDAALEARLDLADVVLEPLQRGD